MDNEGAALREFVRKSGKTQEEFASSLGMTRQNLNNYFLKNKIPHDFKEALAASGHLLFVKSENNHLLKVMEPSAPYKRIGTPYLGELDIFAGKLDMAGADLSEYITGYVSIPGFSDADYFVNVRGHSAYPKYAQGDMIAIKRIDMEFIQYGQFYVVVTKQDRVLKKVRKTVDPKVLCLKSENPEFDDIEVRRSDIRQMFLVLGKITKEVM